MNRREHIKKIAVGHLLQFGYEGTKLADIAGDAGIKKQSMYAHFKDKNELVIEIYEEATRQEMAFLTAFFDRNRGKPMRELLNTFILKMKDRYSDNQNVKLMFLLAFIPPESLQQLFISLYKIYLHHLLHLLELGFDNDPTVEAASGKAALAVHTVYDGLTAKLIFDSPEQFVDAAEVTFTLLWEGIIRSKA
ncbi:TetR/AcrR family transcriptional regulator [Paenibacillus piri]|uniref:TetR/AcrR family transcriptional regulator n=1 Tax=Paenibacillus piri TaxID=2547395 RepID=A0A4R5KX37_9BACL|nr:TetR/AcrR family transcriptional regulator [Paenibacillus piri]TDG00387.1 TetR/AcrR family transcriptional regulator [Paenibacillus piri]